MPHAYPRISIQFCTQCRWHHRAVWYLQELMSTFGTEIGEVALVPAEGGLFRVAVQVDEGISAIDIWDRKSMGGFPDSKQLKQLVREIIAPGKDLGHSEKKGGFSHTHQTGETQTPFNDEDDDDIDEDDEDNDACEL